MPEDLWAPARARRTIGIALATLLMAAGFLWVGLALYPWPPSPGRAAGLLVAGGIWALCGGALLRALVREGRKVGAVYGVKAAKRAGLLKDRPSRGVDEGRSSPPPPPPPAT